MHPDCNMSMNTSGNPTLSCHQPHVPPRTDTPRSPSPQPPSPVYTHTDYTYTDYSHTDSPPDHSPTEHSPPAEVGWGASVEAAKQSRLESPSGTLCFTVTCDLSPSLAAVSLSVSSCLDMFQVSETLVGPVLNVFVVPKALLTLASKLYFYNLMIFTCYSRLLLCSLHEMFGSNMYFNTELSMKPLNGPLCWQTVGV